MKKFTIIYREKGGAMMANYGENGYIDFSKLWEVMEKKRT